MFCKAEAEEAGAAPSVPRAPWQRSFGNHPQLPKNQIPSKDDQCSTYPIVVLKATEPLVTATWIFIGSADRTDETKARSSLLDHSDVLLEPSRLPADRLAMHRSWYHIPLTS